MSASGLKSARKKKGLTEQEVALKLGISQPYVALLESGKRKLPRKLARRVAEVYGVAPTLLPLSANALHLFDPDTFAKELAAVGYPGFSYLRSQKKRNPAELLLKALAQENLESRLTEALPWLLLEFPGMDAEWLLREARIRNLQNRLGFVAGLAAQAITIDGRAEPDFLVALLTELRESRLVREDTLCQSLLSSVERNWLRQNRTPLAEYWNLLTDWRPEYLSYAH